MREIDIDRAGTSGAVLIDCRESDEYAAGHVPHATSMPMGDLPRRIAELDRTRPVHVICATGRRSLTLAEVLEKAGYDAWSVAGGTEAWVRSGRPLQTGVDR